MALEICKREAGDRTHDVRRYGPCDRSTTMATMKTITATELHAIAQDVRIIDVREPREYSSELGHISGSRLVPLSELEEAAERWPRTAPLVLVCRSGSRSGIGCEVLTKLGFQSVTNLTGGMLAWTQAGLPVER